MPVLHTVGNHLVISISPTQKKSWIGYRRKKESSKYDESIIIEHIRFIVTSGLEAIISMTCDR